MNLENLEKFKKEIYNQAELYRVLKNRIKQGLIYEKEKASICEVLPEIEIKESEKDKLRADLVIYKCSDYGGIVPLLVIEVKHRIINKPSEFTKATEKVISYAKKINCLYCAIYDGYYFILFKYPYPEELTRVLEVKVDDSLNEQFAENLCLATAEVSYTGERKYLIALQKEYQVSDKRLVQERIFPNLIKILKRPGLPDEYLIKEWNKYL